MKRCRRINEWAERLVFLMIPGGTFFVPSLCRRSCDERKRDMGNFCHGVDGSF